MIAFTLPLVYSSFPGSPFHVKWSGASMEQWVMDDSNTTDTIEKNMKLRWSKEDNKRLLTQMSIFTYLKGKNIFLRIEDKYIN